MSKVNKLRDDLWCPTCGHQGMKLRSDKAMSGKKRYQCDGCGVRTTGPALGPVQVLPKTRVTDIKKHKYFVITSAVNDTELVTVAHETFKAMADHNDGCYLIIPTVYKNPDLFHKEGAGGLTYPDEIIPHLCNVNLKINDNLIIKGQSRIRQTVINPLAGINHAGSMASEIYAHPQVAMERIATPKRMIGKMLHTTGSISQPNYGGSISAQKAAFHHSISALVIETEGNKFWSRIVHFDGEGCYDLEHYYTPEGCFEGGPVAGMVYGDVHVQALEPKIDTLIKTVDSRLKPKKKVYHDLHDQHIGSHHNKDNVIFALKKAIEKRLSIRDELMMSVAFLNGHEQSYLVDSNHHNHLSQWWNRFNPRNDGANIELYYELGEMLQTDLNAGGDGNLFRLFLEAHCETEVIFVDCDDEFMIEGIDCSQHGDRGPNGSRGSAKGLAKTGNKTMIGHSHTPRIEKGCYQVGVMSPNLDYAKGLSSRGNTHGIIYDNGKRALFDIIDGKLSPLMRK